MTNPTKDNVCPHGNQIEFCVPCDLGEAPSSKQRVSISVEGSELMMELFNRMPVESLKAVPEPIQKRIGQFMVDNGYRFVFDRWFLQADPKAPERSADETTARQRCGWWGEGRGQCLLWEGHKETDHTCEQDGRQLRVALTGLAAVREMEQRRAVEPSEQRLHDQGSQSGETDPHLNIPGLAAPTTGTSAVNAGTRSSEKASGELPLCDCDPDFGCKEYDPKIFRCCQQEMERRAAQEDAP